MAKYIVSSSPHISTTFTTRRMMLDVIIALVPATIASVLLYGFYPFCMMVLCVGSCVFAEWLFNVIAKKYQSVGDLSAIVTGMILSLNLPPSCRFTCDGWRFLCNRDCEDALWRYRQKLRQSRNHRAHIPSALLDDGYDEFRQAYRLVKRNELVFLLRQSG